MKYSFMKYNSTLFHDLCRHFLIQTWSKQKSHALQYIFVTAQVEFLSEIDMQAVVAFGID